jgi:hypothetical protein
MMDENIEKLFDKQYKKFLELKIAHFHHPLDEDGYPTKGALELITSWDVQDSDGWFKFIESIWHMSSWGWHELKEDDRTIYSISTAGWSGNEGIIKAMQGNILWSLFWVSSRRGGHYEFEVRDDQ